MDIQNRSTSKISKPPIAMEKRKQADRKFSREEIKCIDDLKKLYLDTIQLEVELQNGIYNLEKSFEKKYNEIYDRRLQTLQNFKKQNRGGDTGDVDTIKNFWLKVLKASYTEFISKKDEKILIFLSDIRSKLYNDPVVKFVLEFHFEPNEFFHNPILTKTYFLNCLPDVDDPLSYEGAEIYKCEGCKIDWKNRGGTKEKQAFTSFFDFFEPPILPENPNDPIYSDINAILQNDFELGFYLKERVIPKAVLFFTGEIAECLSSGSETESESGDVKPSNEGSRSTRP